MIKNKLFLLLNASILCLTSAGAARKKLGISSFKTTQLNTLRKQTIMKYSYYGLAGNTSTFTVYIINDLYPNGKIIFKETSTSNVSSSFVYNNEYTRSSNNKIRITLQMSSTLSETIEHDLPIVNGSTVKLNNSQYTYTSLSKLFIYSNQGGWSESHQIIEFYNFMDRYVPNYYHNLDIRNYLISISEFPSELTYDSAKLTITNRNGVFDCFPHNNDLAEIPLTIVGNNGEYHLEFSNNLYVNPLTLLMSTTPKAGFVATKNLYFPRNEKKYEDEYTCLITLKGVGVDMNNFLVNFKYKSVLNILGDCHNSEYCIVNR